MPLRRATRRDVPVLVEHRLRMLAELGADVSDPTHARRYRGWVARELAARNLEAFVVAERGRVVASAILWMQPTPPRPGWPRGRDAKLQTVYTEPARRGRGHGTRLAKAAIARARALGCPRVTLHAAEQARPLYRRLGFRRGQEMRLRL